MKNKNILAIFLLLVICFIAVSQVSAVDVASNDVKNFTWFNDTIQQNDYVNLSNDVVLADAEADDFQYGININKSIVIDGNGHIIDAKEVGNIFIIEENNTITLNNITFINSGNSAIVNNGNLIVNNCLFENNTAIGYMMGGAGYGGAINNMGNLTINSTVFINNKAGFGGAIKNEGTASIYYSYFAKNKAGAAGAIYNKGSLTIFDSEFDYNNANGLANFPVPANGGAIECNGNSLTKIINTIFYNNSAKFGAAIYNDDESNLFVEDCEFDFNNGTEGGCIYNNNLMHVTNSIFNLNYANYGGSIYNSAHAIIFNNKFNLNIANYGGAIVNTHNAIISNNIFNNNNALNHTNDISNYCGNISLITNIASYTDYATINNDNGTIVSPVYIYISNTDIIKINETVEIEAYLFDDYGNLIYDERGLELYANDELISGNFSSNETGFYIITGLYPYSTIEKQICDAGYIDVILYKEDTFDELQYLIDNTKENGVLNITKDFISDGKYVYINKNITIYGNNHILNGTDLSGIFYIADGVSANIYGLNFINSVKSAIVNKGIVKLTTCNFKDNRDTPEMSGATTHGGAIRNYGNLNLYICTFVNNKANEGGAIFNEGNLTISSSGSFINNTAAVGGAIYNNKGNINMMNINFENNDATGFYGSYIAKGFGGAIYFKEGILNVVNTYFINSHAKTYGGAIYTYNDNTTTTPIINIMDSYFMDNIVGINAAALYTDAKNTNVSAILNINNCLFSNNAVVDRTGRNAGAIYLAFAKGTIEDSAFENNIASHSCGALYIDGSSIIIDGCTFDSNHGNQYGGAIVILYSNNVTIKNSEFKKNYASIGGSIYSEGTGSVIIQNTSFDNNNAATGGAIYNNITKMYLENCSLDNNNAATGGAIYTVSKLFVKDSLFNNNNVDGFYGSYIGKGFGGAIYNEGLIVVYNNTFINNTAVDYGGAIDNRFVAYIGSNKFLNNNAINGSSAIGNYNATLYLKNNTVSGIGINNKGFIASETYIVVENDDIIGFNESIVLKAYIYDDNGNIIHDERGIPFNINGTIIVGTLESPAIFCSNKTGYYDVSVNYDYSNSTLQEVVNGSITVVDSYKIDINDLSKYYGGSERLEAILTKNGQALAGETVALSINGKTYYIVTDNEGKVSLGINLMPGYYTAEASYGDLVEKAEVEIMSTVAAEDIIKMFHNGTHYVAYFIDSEGNALVNANVTFNINGVLYNRVTDSEGKASLAINLNAGEYIITAYNSVTGQYFSNKIVVLPILVANDVIKMKGGKAQYLVTAYDDYGNRLANVNITININGVQYIKTTDSTGVARLNINLNAGQYIATASYNGFHTSNKITVVEI